VHNHETVGASITTVCAATLGAYAASAKDIVSIAIILVVNLNGLIFSSLE
jgi:hypothetical protein